MKSATSSASRITGGLYLSPLITTAIVIVGLYFGRDVLIPFTLALLLSFLLTPPVTWLERTKVGRAPAVVLVLVVAFSALSGLVWLGATQLADILRKVPSYQANIQRKVEAMRNPAGSLLGQTADSIATISDELSKAGADAPPAAPKVSLSKSKTKAPVASGPDAPVPVELVKGQSGVVESIRLIGMSIAHFAGLAAGVIVFTIFMLMQRSDLRNRLFRLFGQGHLNLMTTALDDAARRVSKYLLTQSLVNGAFGLLLGIGLYWIGVPNAPFWGVLGAILRFVPYIGSLISGACPLVLALAVFDGWTRPLLTLGLFGTIEIVISMAIEPWLYGSHTGLSSLAILLSAAFWTLLWGPIGLILSTPLTVCLYVMGRYVPALSSLGILLGDQPVLPPEACYYQRLLAGDEDEALEVTEAYLKDHTILELYDSVLIPALSLAEQDRHDDNLDEKRAEAIYQNTKSVVDDFDDQPVAKASKADGTPGELSRLSIVCVPARDKADELVGLMLRHVLREAGHKVELIPLGTAEEITNALSRQSAADLFLVSALPPLALSHARSMCRRIRRSAATGKILVGVWNSSEDRLKAEERWSQGTCDTLVTSLKDVEAQIRISLAEPDKSEPLTVFEAETLPT